MKSIKKLSVIAIVLLLSAGLANAQVGFQVGYSSAKVANSKDAAINGFHVGPTFELGIQGPISLQYGLLYNMHLQKEKSSINLPLIGKVEGSVSHTQHILELPVRIAASLPITDEFKFFVFGGPNFSFGLIDNIKTSINDKSVTIKKYDDKDYSRFNLQLGAGAGLQYNNLGVKVSYDWGMLDLYKSDAINYKTNSLKVGLFYNF